MQISCYQIDPLSRYLAILIQAAYEPAAATATRGVLCTQVHIAHAQDDLIGSLFRFGLWRHNFSLLRRACGVDEACSEVMGAAHRRQRLLP